MQWEEFGLGTNPQTPILTLLKEIKNDPGPVTKVISHA
jgi:hypothetical protein